MKEAEIQKAVLAHWRSCGLEKTSVAAIPNAGAFGQYGLTKGLPDLVIIAPKLPVGFIELKTGKGKLSEAQKDYRALCIANGAPYAVTYGRDEPIQVLEAWGVVRRQSQEVSA